MKVKPIIPLIKGTRLIRPENGIQIAAGIGPSGAVSFAMSILERYLGRGEYELDPAFLVFAQWAGEQEEAVQRESGELKKQLKTLMRLVYETRRERQLPSVYVQLLKWMEQTVFFCERQPVPLPGELLMFCRELIREKNQVEAYLRKPEVSSRLEKLLSETGKSPEASWQPLVGSGEKQQKGRIGLRLVSLSMEEKARSAWQLQNYIQRFSDMKKESAWALHQVLTERRSVLKLFEQITPEKQRELERLLPEYFPEGSDPVQVLTAMSRQSWSGLKERIRILTAAAPQRALPVPEKGTPIQPLQLTQREPFLQGERLELFHNFSELVQKGAELEQLLKLLSETESRESRFREAYAARKEAYIRRVRQQSDRLPEEMEVVIGKSPLISLLNEEQETAEFLTECLYEIPELKLYCTEVETPEMEETPKALATPETSEVSRASETSGASETPENRASSLTEIIQSLDANEWKLLENRILQKTAEKAVSERVFREAYAARKEAYIRRVRQQSDRLPEEMEAVIGKSPLISLLNEDQETAEFLTECLYEIPELKLYCTAVETPEMEEKPKALATPETSEVPRASETSGASETPENRASSLAEIIQSLDANEWKLLEIRILQKTAEKAVSARVFREALRAASKAAFEMASEMAAERKSSTVSGEEKSRGEKSPQGNQKEKLLISQLVQKVYEAVWQPEQVQKRKEPSGQDKLWQLEAGQETPWQLQPEQEHPWKVELEQNHIQTGQLQAEQTYLQQLSETESRENRFREAYAARKEEYIRRARQQSDRLPEEMEAVIGKSPLISLLNEDQQTAEFLTECLYEIPELKLYCTAVETPEMEEKPKVLATPETSEVPKASETSGASETLENRASSLAEIIQSLDANEWKLLESRILQSTAEKTVSERVFREALREASKAAFEMAEKMAAERKALAVSGEEKSSGEKSPQGNQKEKLLISQLVQKVYEAVWQPEQAQLRKEPLRQDQLWQLEAGQEQPWQLQSEQEQPGQVELGQNHAQPGYLQPEQTYLRQLHSEMEGRENRFREAYEVRKEEYIRRVRQQSDGLPEEMVAVIGKSPLISLLNENQETADFLTECLYEIPELKLYCTEVETSEALERPKVWAAPETLEVPKASEKTEASETPENRASSLAEIIQSLDANEWKLLENRILQKTEENTRSETLWKAASGIWSGSTDMLHHRETAERNLSDQLEQLFYEDPELAVYTGRNQIEKAETRVQKTAEQEKGLVRNQAAITAAEAVFLKTIQERMEEKSFFSLISDQESTEQRNGEEREKSVNLLRQALLQTGMPVLPSEPGYEAEAKQVLAQNKNMTEETAGRLMGEAAGRIAAETIRVLAAGKSAAETAGELAAEAAEKTAAKTVRKQASETAETVAVETIRKRAVMAGSAITLKTGSRIRELLKEQTKTELCSYEFVMPDRVVVRPVPVRGTEPPDAAGQGDVIREISPEESRSLQTDILKIQRPDKQRLRGEYEQKLKDLSDRLNEQKEELERLQETQHQLSDPRQTQRLINRMMKQLKGQLQLERLQRGIE